MLIRLRLPKLNIVKPTAKSTKANSQNQHLPTVETNKTIVLLAISNSIDPTK